MRHAPAAHILRMFVPVEQQYHRTFIQIRISHSISPPSRAPSAAQLGHLLFSDDSSIALRDVHHLLLVRDPYDWCSPERGFSFPILSRDRSNI